MNIRIVKNDRKARILILTLSIIVFAAVVFLSRIQLKVNLGFDVHLFATANAVINSAVAVLLLVGLYKAKTRDFEMHKKVMLTAILLSFLFLVSYILHHLFAGDTKFGDLDNNGVISDAEKIEGGSLRYIYYILLITHIPLAGIILPFILFTAYRGLINENKAHRRVAKITWPVWFYVAVSGPIIYLMISPYYN